MPPTYPLYPSLLTGVAHILRRAMRANICAFCVHSFVLAANRRSIQKAMIRRRCFISTGIDS
jgi:hypothetical protein